MVGVVRVMGGAARGVVAVLVPGAGVGPAARGGGGSARGRSAGGAGVMVVVVVVRVVAVLKDDALNRGPCGGVFIIWLLCFILLVHYPCLFSFRPFCLILHFIFSL